LELVALLGIAHMAIDGAGNFAVASIGCAADSYVAAIRSLVLYNFLAFATQFALGWGVDRLNIARATAICGCAMAALGALVCQQTPQTALCLCGLGNAMFHVGAGGIVLRLAGSRATLAGLFVAPGSIGVLIGATAGSAAGGAWNIGPWPFTIACLGAIAPLLMAVDHGSGIKEDKRKDAKARSCGKEHERRLSTAAFMGAFFLLAMAVWLRSALGGHLSLSSQAWPRIFVEVQIAAVVAKAAGGFLADRLGWLVVCIGAAVGGMAVFAWGSMSGTGAVAMMVLVQLPMAATLTAVSRLFPRYPAFAFGLTAMWIYLGSLLTMAAIWPAGMACWLQGACAAALVGAMLVVGRRMRGELRGAGRCS